MHRNVTVAKRSNPYVGCLVLFFLIVLGGCDIERAGPLPNLERLRVGVLPDATPDLVTATHQPLLDYLNRRLGIPAELVVPPDYDSLVDQFVNGQIDLAFFGGVTFIRAERRAGAVPLVMRDTDLGHTSYFLAAPGQRERDLEDFRGSRFGFGPEASTSGHWMPRSWLRDQGMEPTTFFAEIRHSRSHEQTAYWVRDGDVDLGVASGPIVDQLFARDLLHSDDVVIVSITAPFANYVWAVRAEILPAFRDELREAFLALNPSNPEHASILDAQSAGGFLPASLTDFENLAIMIDGPEPRDNRGRN